MCVCVPEPLTTLIDTARDAGVVFVYAISPGLDITYSSSKDVICLKHKLEQVASFGCEAFAVLFDDIDVELCDADKSLYRSFASAQVCIAHTACDSEHYRLLYTVTVNSMCVENENTC